MPTTPDGLKALLSPAAYCPHTGVVPVESSVTGELLAQLCTGCGSQLAAGFTPPKPGESLFGGVMGYWGASALVSAGYNAGQVLDALAPH